ncbi:MAG: RNA polymerase sigma factor RpoH, partial [Alphaproteobacteria bacterium]|nr:RNA polymerase sigma factor RpoH [Alphaproteobacteria bacterium]
MTDIVKKPAKTAKKASSTALTASLSPDGSLSRYLREIRKFPMLEAQQEYMLAKSYADHQDTDAAHQLVTSHLRLVAKIAMGYRGYGLPLGEVIQEGNVGLMQAVKKFDAERGFRLATYAMWWIRASIQEYILRSWSLVKIGTTAAQKKLFFNLRKIKGQIDAIDGGQLTPEQVTEISDRLNVSPEDVEQMDGRMSGSDRSLNAPISHGEDDSGEWQDWLEDDREDPEAALVVSDEMDVRREMMQQAMSVLNEREIDILTARRLSEPAATLEELSQKHDVSRERIRQIETRAFEKLRD